MTVWDYPYDLSLAEMVDANGKSLEFCVCETGKGYWGHNFIKLLVRARVAAFGYTTVILRLKTPNGHLSPSYITYEKSDEFINDKPLTMENGYIKAVFDSKTMCLTSLIDKETGRELISEPSCYFRYAEENPRYGMTSWRVGSYMNVVNLNETHSVRLYDNVSNGVFSRLSYELKFGSSVIRAGIILKHNSRVLEYELYVDWNEPALHGEKLPQISFAVPVSYKTTGKSLSDIPYGVIEREALAP